MKKKPKNSSTSQSQQEVVEHVKARLQEEGREARNLVAYSLPLQGFASSSSSSSSVDQILTSETKKQDMEAPQSTKPIVDANAPEKQDFMNPELEITCAFSTETALSSCRVLPHSIPECPSEDPSYGVYDPDLTLNCAGINITTHPSPSPSSQASRTPLLSPTPSIISSESLPLNHRLKVHDSSAREASLTRRGSMKQEKRSRSASAGRNPHQCLRARHWGFLFRNLQQAVDQIYQTCETDESVIECREAILMLERYTKDFRKLIEWLQIKWEYENTPAPQRPTSLAWEVRTRSQTKEPRPLTIKDVRRALNFDYVKQSPAPGDSESTSNRSSSASIADMVKVHQLAAEIAADLTLSSRLNFAAKVDQVLSDRGSIDNSPGGRLESALSDLVLEETETSDEGSSVRQAVTSERVGSERQEKNSADTQELTGKASSPRKLKSPKRSPTSKSNKAVSVEANGKVKPDGTFKIPPLPKQSKKLKSKVRDSKTSPDSDVFALTKDRAIPDKPKFSGKDEVPDTKRDSSKVGSGSPDENNLKGDELLIVTNEGCVKETSSPGENNGGPEVSKRGSTNNSITGASRTASGSAVEEKEISDCVESRLKVTGTVDLGISKSFDDDVISTVKEFKSNESENHESCDDRPRTPISKSTNKPRSDRKSKSICFDSQFKSKALNTPLGKVDATPSSQKPVIKNESVQEDGDADLKQLNSVCSESKNLASKPDQRNSNVRENDPRSLASLKTESKPSNLTCKSDSKATSISKSDPKNIVKTETKASNLAKQDSRAASHLKSEARNLPLSRPDSRNSAVSKPEVKKETVVEAKKLSGEGQSCANTPISKGSSAKTPVVTMNKAWQVRQAFNQSRAPLRQHPQPPGISSLGDAAPPQCYTPALHSQPWLSGSAPSYSAHIRLRGSLQHHQVGGRGCGRRGAASAPAAAGLLSPDTSSSLGPGRQDFSSGRGLVRSHTTLGASTSGRVHHGRQPSHRRSLGDTPSSSCSSQPQSWADKVKGSSVSSSSFITPTTPSSSASTASLLSSQAEESYTADGADDGWEVVRRGRRSYGGSTASLNQHNTIASVPTAVVTSSFKATNHASDAASTSWYRKRFQAPSSATSLPSLSSISDPAKMVDPSGPQSSDKVSETQLSSGGEIGKDSGRSKAKCVNRQVRGRINSSQLQNDKRKPNVKELDHRTLADADKYSGTKERRNTPRNASIVDPNSCSYASGKRMNRKNANPKTTTANHHKVPNNKENTSNVANVSVSLPVLPMNEDSNGSTSCGSKYDKSENKEDSPCLPSALKKSKSLVLNGSEDVKLRGLKKAIYSGAAESVAHDAKANKEEAKRHYVSKAGDRQRDCSKSKSVKNFGREISRDSTCKVKTGAGKKETTRDPKNFFKRGRASSDACLELRGGIKIDKKADDPESERGNQDSREELGRKSTNLATSRDFKSDIRGVSSENETPAPDDGSAGVCYQYGGVMTELHEEADEAVSTDAVKADPDKTDISKANTGAADVVAADVVTADVVAADAGAADAGAADAGAADAVAADAGAAVAADAGVAVAAVSDAVAADAEEAVKSEVNEVLNSSLEKLPSVDVRNNHNKNDHANNRCNNATCEDNEEKHFDTGNNNSNRNGTCKEEEEREEEDPEDAADEADLRHNAAAIECAVAEEERLKQQIHDTENTDCAAAVST
ncbi:S phase cyclin A-associated protein in the endoplasmic reticulum N-terminal [Trinorchestia longiramus]|nr:S phase cyclin A-associated protein in the endoplasmic reticulum N-terminal [Trinorchestia longiramus]